MDDQPGVPESSRPSTEVLKAGDRQLFTVELRPGETTIVSWKKLVRDSSKVNALPPATVPEPPANAHPALESRIAPVQQVQPAGEGEGEGEEGKDEAAPNRFSAVIEKIERLYMGKDSSDDEDQNIPDDDQYDTEDSFIDDAELDEYFEVDNSAIKHDGFFVNRGQLERINTTAALPNQQPKKRRRKDTKSPGETDEGNMPNKQAKLGKTAAAKVTSGLAKNSAAPSTIAVTTEHREDVKFQNQLNSSGYSSSKKSADSRTVMNPSALKALDGDASALQAELKDVDKSKSGVLLPKDSSNRLKDAGGSSDSLYLKYHDKSVYSQTKTQSGRLSSNADELDTSVRPKAKNGIRLPDLNLSDVKYSVPTTKTSHVHRKEGSSVRPKGSMLEKAIRELERMVAESRPPTMENPEGDNSSQAIKRRLPREIKMKLAKVARLAGQASHGKISKELLNRLMSILGHLIQLRTLKRNMKVMISMGLSAKKEKDDRFQHIKKEVHDMVKINVSSSESKALEHQAGGSDDFQETASGAKEVSKRKFSMDPALEDKICDLYDLYVDGLDEDTGPQIRKLYAELAGLWPSGFMDNHGIKSAICRAKDRRRERYSQNKDQEKMRRKKMLTPKEESVRVEASSTPQQQQYIRERLVTEPGSHGSGNKSVSGTTAAVRIPSPINGPSYERLKQEKLKGSASNSPDDTRVGDGGALIKKKVKRKPDQEMEETRIRPEKLPSQQGEERQKSLKQIAGVPHKSNHQSTGLPSLEQSS